MRSLLNGIGLVLLFIMAAFPMVLSLLYVKAALFTVLLGALSIRVIHTGRTGIHPTVFLWAIGLAAVGCVGVMIGVARGGPGAVEQFDVFVAWPLIHVFILGMLGRKELQSADRALWLASFIIGGYGLLFVAAHLSIFPGQDFIRWFALGERQGAGFYDGYVELSFQGLNSLPFLAPFVIAGVLLPPAYGVLRVRRHLALRCLVMVLVVAIIILSGRRALLLVTAVTPFLALAFALALPSQERRTAIQSVLKLVLLWCLLLVLAVLVPGEYSVISPDGIFKMFAQGFDFTENDSASIRAAQFHALLNAAAQHPLLGNGLGNYVQELVRNTERPWDYELFYMLLFFNFGLPMFLLYVAAIGWIYFWALKIMRRGGEDASMMLRLLCGLTGVLIATATNPYLARFDGLWMLFFPLALINFYLRSARHGIDDNPL